jgi:murein DD-endopeptidase MepM/ murein hydrolase activator NlpD
MRTRLRAGAVVAVLVLLLGDVGSNASPAKPRPHHLTAAITPMAVRELLGRADGLFASIIKAETDLASVQRRLAMSLQIVDAARSAVASAKHDFAHRSEEAQVAAASLEKTPRGAPMTLVDLIEPLQAASDALSAGGRLQIAILAAHRTIREEQLSTSQLAAQVGAMEFRLELRHVELQQILNQARRLAFVEGTPMIGSGEASPMDAVVPVVTRFQLAQDELRGSVIALRSTSVRLVARQDALVQYLRTARHRGNRLDTLIAGVEELVAARYGTWFELTGGLELPVIGGVLEVCPVGMPHAYSDDFGAPRWGGGFHPHQGNDIFAPEGTPIYAPFDGVAVKAENALGGQAVKVYGRLGYVYNAHLSAYGILGRVNVGTIIGYVGNTGNAINSAPHDHFEWHPGNGAAVDPFPYLNAVCIVQISA